MCNIGPLVRRHHLYNKKHFDVYEVKHLRGSKVHGVPTCTTKVKRLRCLSLCFFLPGDVYRKNKYCHT